MSQINVCVTVEVCRAQSASGSFLSGRAVFVLSAAPPTFCLHPRAIVHMVGGTNKELSVFICLPPEMHQPCVLISSDMKTGTGTKCTKATELATGILKSEMFLKSGEIMYRKKE